MRYKGLPKKWKVITSVLIVLNALLIILIILFTLFLSSYREQCAQLRAPLKKDDDFNIASLVLCYPWTTGLPTKNLSSDCPKTLFVLAGEDPISQKSKSYIEAMKAAGVDVEVIEYDSAVHSFIESNNPEGKNDSAEGMEKVINPMQEKMAREAENYIGKWLNDGKK